MPTIARARPCISSLGSRRCVHVQHGHRICVVMLTTLVAMSMCARPLGRGWADPVRAVVATCTPGRVHRPRAGPATKKRRAAAGPRVRCDVKRARTQRPPSLARGITRAASMLRRLASLLPPAANAAASCHPSTSTAASCSRLAKSAALTLRAAGEGFSGPTRAFQAHARAASDAMALLTLAPRARVPRNAVVSIRSAVPAQRPVLGAVLPAQQQHRSLSVRNVVAQVCSARAAQRAHSWHHVLYGGRLWSSAGAAVRVRRPTRRPRGWSAAKRRPASHRATGARGHASGQSGPTLSLLLFTVCLSARLHSGCGRAAGFDGAPARSSSSRAPRWQHARHV